ncbi:dGTP triphosphohydrolase [Cellulomonas sp. 179-A 4D5 NHS]|uniref:dGTP triphosphohydrolase n=1 Tax=Cellulomonas sp. 179-A 4D5 NHS TaxID=3142378 RepID=UPI0039A3EB3C
MTAEGGDDATGSVDRPPDLHERVDDVARVQEPWRSDAHVDVDRLLYSPEFRRLAGVTQVVPPQDDFHFHDRLTHSIKVAQVAETLARKLKHDAKKDPAFQGIELDDWLDPRHCYAAGLAHDIGHPPFGHAGEEALQEMFDATADDGVTFWLDDETKGRSARSDSERLAERSFEGNAQSMRVVTKLSFRGDALTTGLNLTLRTLAGIAKYPWTRGGHPVGTPKLAKKWSFYTEESDILDRLVRGGYVRVQKDDDGAVVRVDRWVEAEIMDWADDISYAVHDVDDFYRAGLIPLGQIANVFVQAPNAINWLSTDFDFVEDETLRESLLYICQKLRNFQQRDTSESEADRDRHYAGALLRIKEFAQGPCPKAPFSGTGEAHRNLQRFSSAVIVYLSNAASLKVDDRRVQLHLDPTAVLVAEFFKALNSYFVIESVTLAAMQYGQVENLRSLFPAMVDMAHEWMEKRAEGKVSGRLPARLRSYLAVLDGDGSDDGATEPTGPDLNDIAVAVLDYITSLRDIQAAHLTSQLTGSRETPALYGHWLNT